MNQVCFGREHTTISNDLHIVPDILEDHYHCRMEYAKNRCDPSTRLPAMDEQCRRWQQCLYRPMWVGK